MKFSRDYYSCGSKFKVPDKYDEVFYLNSFLLANIKNKNIKIYKYVNN